MTLYRSSNRFPVQPFIEAGKSPEIKNEGTQIPLQNCQRDCQQHAQTDLAARNH